MTRPATRWFAMAVVGCAVLLLPAQATFAAPATEGQTLLLVRARADRFPVPVGERTALVRGLRTDGALAGVRTWCEYRGSRLPRDAQRRWCHFQVSGATRTQPPDRPVHRRLRVSAIVTCSAPRLQVRVRIPALRPGAAPSVFNRRWSVQPATGVPCRLRGTG